MQKPFIDAHVHFNSGSLEKLGLAEKYDMAFLSINTDIPFFEPLETQEEVVQNLKKTASGRLLHICSFHNGYWNTEKWLPHVLQQIKNGIRNGAVGVKLWKNIGMDPELKDRDGQFVMIDDPRFDPVFEYLSKHNILLIGHQGEPLNCWLPLEEMTMNSDREYFGAHPEYHMYLHPDFPDYQQQMAARDHMLQKHPELHYVGLHLFSMEWNLKEVGKRLDQFPNTMTDLAERICHVQFQALSDRDAVRSFFIKYQDRIIYGTDVIDDGTRSATELARHFESLWENHYTFFATDQTLTVPEFEGSFRGLELPETVLEKIFYKNAVKTYGFTV